MYMYIHICVCIYMYIYLIKDSGVSRVVVRTLQPTKPNIHLRHA